MRSILLDWLMEVSMEFSFKRETYHISINYIDRYLNSTSDIKKTDL